MGASNYHPSLGCEVRIKQAKNVESKSTGTLFVRYFLLSAGGNKRVQLNTQEIPSKLTDLTWNEGFSLECLGAEDEESLSKNLKQQSVVFELRFRSSKPSAFGKRRKSQLLGRAEVPWKATFESSNMEMEKWIAMSGSAAEGMKTPLLLVGMKIEGVKMVEMERKGGKLRESWDECGCCGCRHEFCNCRECYDVFALAAALEAL